ncbi:MAG: hypothetical protein HC824_00560 [Synechococcales cyanobacterium RM1_1_8]|nr:hypothetical protein [Synechococcales cyanobacterium RM1_1_8]
MDDQVLIHVLEAACGDDRLIFQVVEQGQRLHIFINRGPEDRLDYPALGKKIYQAFRRLRLGGIEGVCLYSRVLGEEEPDWEAKFRLAKPAAAPVQARPAVLEAAAIAQTPLQRRISEADTYVRREDGEGGAIAPGSEPSPPARTQRRHAQTLPQAPIPAAAAYPLGDEDGAAEAAELYEAAAPTISVMAEPPQPAVGEALAAHGSAHEPAHEPAHEAGADLSNYCFISNRRLLTASLLPPPKALAKLLLDLHGFLGQSSSNSCPGWTCL